MADVDSIRCMQLPLVDLQLLLPNSAVAEIIGYAAPEGDNAGSGWYDGKISWRGVMVPVVSVEQMCEIDAREPGPRSRIAIIYNPSGDEALPYIGLILQDIPRAYLAEQDRLQDVLESPGCEYILGRADVMLEQLVIPDLDAIIKVVKQRTSH